MLFVFMSQPDFACNPYALYEYIRRNTEHDTAWILKKDERYYGLKDRGIPCAVYNTLEGNQLLDRADYVITNSYTFPNLPKREGQIFVNLWHGSGIKAHDYFNHDMNPLHAKKLERFFEKIDLMCVHSLDDRFKLAAQLHYDLRRCYVTGQARLDCVKTSDGAGKLKKLFGERLGNYQRYIFFAPSFRANMSSHSGVVFSDNIFRLAEYDDSRLNAFLEKYNAALIYKLHPVEQTAFSGRKFQMSRHCFELTDQMLFDADIRYDELLNAFDVMMSDYSSIVYDYLLLNRPVVYLIPDYEEYTTERGFVFHNVGLFMPGPKAFCFDEMLASLEEAFEEPDKYREERGHVLAERFDFDDGQAARRCYETILAYKPPVEAAEETADHPESSMPSSCELLRKWIPEQYELLDSTRELAEEHPVEEIRRNSKKEYLYITEEIPRELRKLTGASSTEIRDIAYYHEVAGLPNVRVCLIRGGVEYGRFSAAKDAGKYKGGRRRIGFAGTIDNRIFFAMVQCICEVFSDCDIIFAGEIYGPFPVWLDGFDNLHYVCASYEELPELIQSFDVAFLPFFGRHTQTVPKEFYQYLACGKQVVASDMSNLPECAAVYRSASVGEAVENMKKALGRTDDGTIAQEARNLAAERDWDNIAKTLW